MPVRNDSWYSDLPYEPTEFERGEVDFFHWALREATWVMYRLRLGDTYIARSRKGLDDLLEKREFDAAKAYILHLLDDLGVSVQATFGGRVLVPTKRNVQPLASRKLHQLEAWIPRRHREAITGDLWEDLNQFRSEGWTEKQLVRHIRRQFAVILAERLLALVRPDRWAWFAAVKWVFRVLRG